MSLREAPRPAHRRRDCRHPMAGAAAGASAVPAMAAARPRARVFARSQRSRPDLLRRIRRRERHRGHARRFASRRRRHGAALFATRAAPDSSGRRRLRLRAVGAVHPVVERPHCRLVAVVARALRRHRQSGLFPHQAGALAHGRAHSDSGHRRCDVPYAAGRRLMPWLGLVLLLLVGVGIIGTGQPAAVVLIAAASLGAVAGLASGTISFDVLGALPGRLINLLENDLLQALPLYVTMGLLLDRLPVADALYRSGNALMRRSPSVPIVG